MKATAKNQNVTKNEILTKKANEMKNESLKNQNEEIVKNNLETISDDFIKNLDSLNLESIEKITLKNDYSHKVGNKKDNLYKNKPIDKEQQKKFRQKMRKLRESFQNKICFLYSQNDSENLKKEIKNFLEFYKNEYVLNDFSLNSLVYPNADGQTKEKTTEFLTVLKQILSI